jgi:hypothetical protein
MSASSFARPMNPDASGYILIASLAGGLSGALVTWNRKRAQVAGASRLRQVTVMAVGTAASVGALVAFAKAFGLSSSIYAGMASITITGWAAVLQSTARLPVPRSALHVRSWELAVLRSSWSGVRLFGAILRKTPLRRLGGRVYLSEVGGDTQVVLRGIDDAEAVHVWALVCCAPWLVFWGITGLWMSVGVGLAVHLPLNIYPILHLRYVTGRIERYAARGSHRCSTRV